MDVFLLAAIAGVIIGVFSGMLGIGGGTLMVPLFRLVFNLSAVASTATSLFAIIPTSLVGAITHIRHHTCIPTLGIALGIGGALTSPIGVWAAQILPAWVVMAAAAAVILYSVSTMFSKALSMGRTKVSAQAQERIETQTAGQATAAQTAQSSRDVVDTAVAPFAPSRTLIAKCFAIGVFAGLVSGFVGVGGGFIMIPLLLSIAHIPMKLASGTSLIAVSILALPAVIEQVMLGNINYLVGLALACGSMPGSTLGARLVKRIPERELRLLFGTFLGFAAILLIAKELNLLG